MRTIHGAFEAQARFTPEATALVDALTGLEASFATLNNAANSLALRLLAAAARGMVAEHHPACPRVAAVLLPRCAASK